MKLSEYLQKEIDKLVVDIVAKAPVDVCPRCCHDNAKLTYESNTFLYKCDKCGARWPADVLDLDEKGRFSVLEWAD